MSKQRTHNTQTIYFTDRLKDQMDQLLNYPCTLVEAPMGYGKTTAVREYLKGNDAHVLWHRVFDGSVSGFWTTFCRLFRKLDPIRSADLERLDFPNDSVSMQEAFKIIQEIVLPEDTVLVIDDYHLVGATDVSNFLWSLVINEIDHLHIVLTARYAEHYRIEELSRRGYLYHIGKDTFELTPKEITEYYRLCGISLKAAEVEQLFSISEGWISALYLLMLNIREHRSFEDTNNIQKLVKNTVYDPFSEDMKAFLLSLCIYDSFTLKQAIHMWGDDCAEKLLSEVMVKNAFVSFDADTKTYQIHSIFTSFLRQLLERKEQAYKKNLYEKAGLWCMETGDNLTAMHYFFLADDFESLLCTAENDRTASIGYEQKEFIIKYFEQCPPEVKNRHPIALLVYAMTLMTFNEMGLFQKTCEELAILIRDSNMDAESSRVLTGEMELLLSFARYNDIMGMSEHHKRACALLKEPSSFMDTTGSWTFGSPSVLYMFYRESGKLEQEVLDMKEAMPYYYRLTAGHGTGAEQLMEAEMNFNRGDFENAEIMAQQALRLASSAHQPNMVLCAQFLQSRIALIQGDYACILELSKEIREVVESSKLYTLMHTIDMCKGFIDACLQQGSIIPEWLANGDFSSNRLFFPARAFFNMIYGRALLISGEYEKLLGISGHFIGIASIFPNVLPIIYTNLYIGAANERIFRRDEAISAVRQALELAAPDKVYMPFVENCDFISPLLAELCNEEPYREDITKILELYSSYQKAVDHINRTYFIENRPQLSEREEEIARFASEGLSNRQIGERLFISENTVKKHLKGVFDKLGISSRSLLTQYFDTVDCNRETKSTRWVI